ncbi:MAG: oligosaccharide flippase family protein [Candidatus Nanoarchaeia archaeon]
MKHYKKITGQLALMYSATLMRMLFSFFLFVVLARTFTKGEYGIISLFLVTIALMNKYLTLGLPEYIVKDFAPLSEKTRVKRMGAVFTFGVIFSAVVGGIGLLILRPALTFFNLASYGSAALFTLLLGVMLPLHVILTAYFTSKQKIGIAETFSTLTAGWMLLVIGLALYAKLTVNVLFAARFWFEFVIFILLMWVMFKDHIRFVFDKELLKSALMFSLPLLPLYASEYFITAGDRYLLGWFSGSIAVGSYTYFYSLLSFIITMSIIPTNMLFTYAAKAYKKNKDKSNFYFNAAAKYSLLLALPALTGLYVLREPIVTLISGPKYVNDLYILGWLIAFPLLELVSALYRRICILRDKTFYLGRTYVAAGVLNLVLNIVLIPYLGVIGAAIATLVTYALLAVLLFWEAGSYVPWNNEYIQIHKLLFATICMGLLVGFVHPEVIWSKIFTIGFGILSYFGILFAIGGFVKEERDLVLSFVR